MVDQRKFFLKKLHLKILDILYQLKLRIKNLNRGYSMIKVKKRKFLLLPGDGIGPEVIGEVKKVIQWFNKNKSLDFEIDEDLAGGADRKSVV